MERPIIKRPSVSRRGVYYNVSESPYEYKTSWGDILHFSSAKRLEIYTRELPKRAKQVEKSFIRISSLSGLDLRFTPMLLKHVEMALYDEIER
jgi:hypothetical protein